MPAMTQASETWTLTKASEWRLTAAQINVERALNGVSWQDRRAKPRFVTSCTSSKPENGLGLVP